MVSWANGEPDAMVASGRKVLRHGRSRRLKAFMQMPGHDVGSARVAKARLLQDKVARSRDEKRAALDILSRRLDRALRDRLLQFLAGRVSTDPRVDPILQKLIWAGRMAG